MKIGIIGSGALGSNIARAFSRKGLPALIANRKGPASMANLIEELGPTIKAGTIQEASSADIVILAVPWVALEKLVAGLPSWENRIVIDATNAVLFIDPNSPEAKDPTNPLAVFGIKAVDLGGKYSSSIVRTLIPRARLVKAFNHLDAKVLPEPEALGGKRTLFYAGDDASAKAEVRKLLEAIGYFPVDLGVLDVGGPLMESPFGALAMSNFIKV